MTALAVTPDGVTQGISAQRWWMRDQRQRLSKSSTREVQDKETRFWIHTIDDAFRAFEQGAPSCRPWFQLDREGDNLAIFEAAHDKGIWLTARARFDRRLRFPGQPLKRYRKNAPYLNAHLSRRACIGTSEIQVTNKATNEARCAIVELRSASVLLERTHPRSSAVLRPVAMNAVLLKEINAPQGVEPLETVLLTTAPTETLEQVRQAVRSYALRWRIEEFHRAWKSGCCNVEDTQLLNAKSVMIWATLLAAVATRIERLKYLVRQDPDRLARFEFDEAELEALRLLKYRVEPNRPLPEVSEMTVEQATLHIAELGGYQRSKGGGPPGTVTITRGLEWIRVAAEVLRAQDTLPSDRSRKKKRR